MFEVAKFKFNILLNELGYFIIFLLIAGVGIWLRPSLFGFDGYATSNAICFGDFEPLSHQFFANLIWSVLPCNLIIFKLIMFFSLLACVFIAYKIVLRYTSPKNAFFSIVLLFCLSPLFIFEFAKFENELLAYPFILLGLFFLTQKDIKKIFMSVPFFVVSIVFWGWPFYFQWIRSDVLEHQLFGGMLPLFFLLLVIPFFFLTKNKWILFLGSVFLVMFFWQVKFFIFLMPFVLIALTNLLEIVEEKEYNTKYLWLVALFLLFGWNYALFVSQPTFNDWVLVDSIVELQEKTSYPVFNDWSYGYWLKSRGVETSFFGGGKNPSYLELEKPFIAFTDFNLDSTCDVFDELSSNVRSVKIYICN